MSVVVVRQYDGHIEVFAAEDATRGTVVYTAHSAEEAHEVMANHKVFYRDEGCSVRLSRDRNVLWVTDDAGGDVTFRVWTA